MVKKKAKVEKHEEPDEIALEPVEDDELLLSADHMSYAEETKPLPAMPVLKTAPLKTGVRHPQKNARWQDARENRKYKK